MLFLLDLKMPVKDGLEVLRWLHEHPEIPTKLPVVVLSSTALPTETQLAYALDIQACTVKPISFADLQPAIAVAVKRFKELHSLRNENADLKQALADRKLIEQAKGCLLYTSPSPRDRTRSRMPSSA